MSWRRFEKIELGYTEAFFLAASPRPAKPSSGATASQTACGLAAGLSRAEPGRLLLRWIVALPAGCPHPPHPPHPSPTLAALYRSEGLPGPCRTEDTGSVVRPAGVAFPPPERPYGLAIGQSRPRGRAAGPCTAPWGWAGGRGAASPRRHSLAAWPRPAPPRSEGSTWQGHQRGSAGDGGEAPRRGASASASARPVCEFCKVPLQNDISQWEIGLT